MTQSEIECLVEMESDYEEMFQRVTEHGEKQLKAAKEAAAEAASKDSNKGGKSSDMGNDSDEDFAPRRTRGGAITIQEEEVHDSGTVSYASVSNSLLFQSTTKISPNFLSWDILYLNHFIIENGPA